MSTKCTADIKPGDRIVYGGVQQTVEVVLHDAECPHDKTCPPEANCPGGVSIQTDVSGEGNWIATFFVDERLEVDTTNTVCPPWCVQDPTWHEDNVMHSTWLEVVTTGCLPGCRYHDEDPASADNADAWVSLDRYDDADLAGATLVTLNFGGLSPRETHFSPDRADKLADTLRRMAALARAADADTVAAIKADMTGVATVADKGDMLTDI